MFSVLEKVSHAQTLRKHPADTESAQANGPLLLVYTCQVVPTCNKFLRKKPRLHWKYQNTVKTCDKVLYLMIDVFMCYKFQCLLQAVK